ncbi:alcohol dehydrogenase [Staphylococcus nepalensis]|uniref:zinc-binding alcohol dehydrogenase family protein n=1 Tax=Staphylococcus TaxID=1279 RepID=UPI000BC31AA0|nr:MULTISPECIES: zinc-binding alcohol dehydrogenase family protein [Staphylococcus]ATH59531.1 alcohol dehydrogenase [Staphylococcus nepalensis]ATH64622.1 alcohol dehydrogenase [Staphylococcus nepalensis]AWI43979.1 alcohol dehydrogenase [Staphylococcus nepalensis]NWN85020.1 zinc-binding alcohol dehydrogenase family protein [Staphylococcus sp.]
MKAVGADKPFKLNEGNQFYEMEQEMPQPKQRELLVRLKAISVNPVDTKIRQSPLNEAPRILGYDAVGVVEAVGDAVKYFKAGDEVYYSGSPAYQGSNQTHQLVDEQLVAFKPNNISDTEAASLPLTGLTASETLFDVFKISHNPEDNKGKSLLIINGAGGVGSIATQIAKHYGLHVITTASRDETYNWSKSLGADIVLNHKNNLADEFKKYEISEVDYIFCTFDTDLYYEKMIELIKPRGIIATIVAFNNKQDLNLLKPKSITFTHEYMYSRPLNETEDMGIHGEYLKDIADKIEAGIYKPTVNKVINGLTADNIYQAHKKIEDQSMVGKLVISI